MKKFDRCFQKNQSFISVLFVGALLEFNLVCCDFTYWPSVDLAQVTACNGIKSNISSTLDIPSRIAQACAPYRSSIPTVIKIRS